MSSLNKLFPLVSATLILSACSTIGERNPASFSTTVFAEIVADINNTSESLTVDTAKCAKDMGDNYQKLYELVGSSVYFEMDNTEILDKDIETSFLSRLKLRDSIKSLQIKNPTDKACFESVANVFKALRYVEDYMIEMRMERTEGAPNEYVDMKGQFPYLLVNPKFESTVKSYEDLISGDVILSRGNAFSSAAIARIGENDFQFSHLSFVYQNPNELNRLYTTEAHIEIGSVVAPIEDHIASKNARSVVFRHKDSKLSADASEYIFNKVKEKSETGKNIEYDFSMNYKDNSKLFCSEVISTAFNAVNPKQGFLPKFKSHFTPGMIPFLNNIGVPVTKENVSELDVFSPGDIQFDPSFDLVLEWRNPRKMEESRFKDFILTKLFDKMEKEGYQFDPSLKMDVQTKTFWLLRRTPIIKKFLEKKFSLNMSPTQMEMFMTLDKVGDILYKELEKKSIESDHPLTPKEVYIVLDKFIATDKTLIHKYFHP
jgi:hypothetical protein